MSAVDGTPVDLAAVQADDALLGMLSGPVVVTDDQLARVLYAWRRDVDAEPVGDLVEPDVAVRVVAGAVAARRVVLALAAFVAALVVVASALGLVALDAEPGDLLWPVHELLYPTDGE